MIRKEGTDFGIHFGNSRWFYRSLNNLPLERERERERVCVCVLVGLNTTTSRACQLFPATRRSTLMEQAAKEA